MRQWIYACPLLVAPACSSATGAPSCPPSAAVAPLVVAPAESSAASSPESRGARRESPCWAKGHPRALAAKKSASSYCAPLEAKEVARVEARIRKDFVVYESPSKLVIDFGCDVASGATKEIFFEDGSGHGGTLRIVQMRRDGDRYVVRMIDSSHYHGEHVEVLASHVDARVLDARVASARVALLARPHLVRLSTPAGGLGLSGMVSSRDFHLRLSIFDGNDVTDRRFTGYESSSDQEDYLPMRLAAEPIEKLLAGTSFAPSPITDDDERMFTERFIVTMADAPNWWVKERYVALAATLGTIDAVPALVALIAAKGEASKDRTRAAALAAIAAITGWDPRVDVGGKPRSTDDAAATALRECVP